MKSIILYKYPGLTVNQLLLDYFNEKYRKDNNIQKVCFAGRLDPMARGYILFLLNEECKKINLYKFLQKTYIFKIIIGIQTDSDDPLGFLEAVESSGRYQDSQNCTEIIDKLHGYLTELKGSSGFWQEFHHYSSKCLDGNPMWYYKKNKIEIVPPKHTVMINDFQINSLEELDYLEWSHTIIDQINTIDKKCDFNQEKIINQWKNFICNGCLYAIPVKLSVSSGFYIRQFVRDFSRLIKVPLLTYDIFRTEIYF